MNFCSQSASWASDCLFSSFFKAPQASGCTFTVVLSKHTILTLMLIMPSVCKAVKILSRIPFLLHLFILTYIVCQFPYSFGNALHLHPFSATYKRALRNWRFVILTFPRCFGRYFDIFSYCSCVIFIFLFYQFCFLFAIVWTLSSWSGGSYA